MFENQLKSYQEARRVMYQNISDSIQPDNNSATSRSHSSATHTTDSSQDRCTFGIGRGPAKNSLKICTLPLYKGIAIHIHYAWPIFIVLATLSALQVSPLYSFYSFLLGGPILFLTVLIHELGHSVMAIHLGGAVDLILLWPLGGLAYISFFGETNPRADALVAIAGPLTHIPQICFWYFLYITTEATSYHLNFYLSWSTLWPTLCSGAVLMQISLCLFNLIPAFPLDGGRLLAALMAWRGLPRKSAYKVSAITGGFFAMWLLLRSLHQILRRDSTFFWGWNTLALSLFILNQCRRLWKLSNPESSDVHPGYQAVQGSGAWSTSASSYPPAVTSTGLRLNTQPLRR